LAKNIDGLMLAQFVGARRPAHEPTRRGDPPKLPAPIVPTTRSGYGARTCRSPTCREPLGAGFSCIRTARSTWPMRTAVVGAAL